MRDEGYAWGAGWAYLPEVTQYPCLLLYPLCPPMNNSTQCTPGSLSPVSASSPQHGTLRPPSASPQREMGLPFYMRLLEIITSEVKMTQKVQIPDTHSTHRCTQGVVQRCWNHRSINMDELKILVWIKYIMLRNVCNVTYTLEMKIFRACL